MPDDPPVKETQSWLVSVHWCARWKGALDERTGDEDYAAGEIGD